MTERWNQTTITWAMWGWGFDGDTDRAETRTPVSALPDIAAYHVCTSMRAIQLRGPRMTFEIEFNNDKYEVSARDKELIKRDLSYLKLKSHNGGYQYSVVTEDATSITLDVGLRQGMQFCEAAIEFAIEVAQVLGVKDEHRRIMGNFAITQETMIKKAGEWTPMVAGLREQFGLKEPHMGSSGN